jgi:TetR/AcrR family transcriptional repressor of nem operon
VPLRRFDVKGSFSEPITASSIIPARPLAKKKVNREFIIREALQLFRDQGYHATSMNDIGEACGLLKGSIYHYFSSKEDLMKAVIVYLHEYYRHNAFRHAINPELGARQKLSMLASFYQELFYGQDGGCLMANIAMETNGVVPAFNEPIRLFFEEWISAMEAIYREELSPDQAASLARETVEAVEGATMMMRVFNNRDYLQQALDRLHAKYERLTGEPLQEAQSSNAPEALENPNSAQRMTGT